MFFSTSWVWGGRGRGPGGDGGKNKPQAKFSKIIYKILKKAIKPKKSVIQLQNIFFLGSLMFFRLSGLNCIHFLSQKQWFLWGDWDSNSQPLVLDRTYTSALDRSAITSSTLKNIINIMNPEPRILTKMIHTLDFQPVCIYDPESNLI